MVQAQTQTQPESQAQTHVRISRNGMIVLEVKEGYVYVNFEELEKIISEAVKRMDMREIKKFIEDVTGCEYLYDEYPYPEVNVKLSSNVEAVIEDVYDVLECRTEDKIISMWIHMKRFAVYNYEKNEGKWLGVEDIKFANIEVQEIGEDG